ncbi:hypothetical protein B0H13DRAFT_1133657 [Mycena leptocephala]|nr:hypothetical protein B0H13DRAFT_1133657 [Mycena leptocephala]
MPDTVPARTVAPPCTTSRTCSRSSPPTPPTLPSLPPRAPRPFSAVHRPRRLKHGPTFTTPGVCRAHHSCSPSPAPPLSPPRAPSASPASRTLPVHARASAHLQYDKAHPRHAQHMGQSLRIARTALITSPCAATVSSASPPSARSRLLSGTRSTTWTTLGVCSKCGARSPSPTSPSLPPRAPCRSSAPTLASARNLDLPRPLTWQIAPPCRWIPARASSAWPRANGSGLVRGGGVCGERGNGRDGRHAPSVRRFAYGLGYIHIT